MPKDVAGRKVALEKATSTLAMAAAIPEERRVLVDCSPVEIFKAVKNDVEIAGLRKAGRRDCAALCAASTAGSRRGWAAWAAASNSNVRRLLDDVEGVCGSRRWRVGRLRLAGAALGADGRRARSRQ